MKVLRAKVLETDQSKSHVEFVLTRTMHEYFSYGHNPFYPETVQA